MKLNIEQSEEIAEVEITVRCGHMDERLAALVRQIQLYAFAVPAKKEGRSFMLAIHQIYYFESVDERTYVYGEQDVYQCELRLYELEEQLAGTSFVRIGKSMVLNTAFVQSVRPLLGGRMEALLENGEKVYVSRHYLPAFKAQFGLGEETL